MKHENQFENILNKKRTVKLPRTNLVQKPVRMPEEIWVLIRDELRAMEDAGEKTTYNDFVMNVLLSTLNINQNDKGEWKVGNKMGFDYYSKQKNKK